MPPKLTRQRPVSVEDIEIPIPYHSETGLTIFLHRIPKNTNGDDLLGNMLVTAVIRNLFPAYRLIIAALLSRCNAADKAMYDEADDVSEEKEHVSRGVGSRVSKEHKEKSTALHDAIADAVAATAEHYSDPTILEHLLTNVIVQDPSVPTEGYGRYYDRAMDLPLGMSRRIALSAGVKAAVRAKNVLVLERLLREDISVRDFDSFLKIATANDSTVLLALLVESLMSDRKIADFARETAAFFTAELGAGDMDPTHVVVDRKMLVSLVVERTQALLRCLEVAIEKGEPGRECVQILLPAYLECAAEIGNQYRATFCDSLKTLGPEDYLGIPRRDCLRLLGSKVPARIGRVILRRLAIEDEPRDLELYCGGERFCVHRDVMCWRSPYVKRLCGGGDGGGAGGWTRGDENGVDLSGRCSPEALAAVIDWVYSGEFGSEQVEGLRMHLEDVVDAAGMLEMVPLVEIVKKVVHGLRQRGEL